MQNKEDDRDTSKISPWVIGFVAFVLIGSTVFQVLNGVFGKHLVN